ncbi:MAG: GNAT family N-acetyltransferase [Candidatus Dormibacteria bacterium]
MRLVPWEGLDPAAILALVLKNRAHLQPWEPARSAAHFTLSGQREAQDRVRSATADGREAVFGVTSQGLLVGRVALTGIERGPFQSCHLGYWIAASHCGLGLASQAVAAAVELAFGELSLHRVEAAVMPANAASCRVLEKNSFRQEGLALSYLQIGGGWADHLIFAKTAS